MTDALVLKQLEALYALGILEREEEEGEERERGVERVQTHEEGAGLDRRLSLNELSWSGVSVRSTSRPSEVLGRPLQSDRPTKDRRRRDGAPFQMEPIVAQCFGNWKRYATEHRHAADLRILADACLKKRGVSRWCGYLHFKKYEQERELMMQRWKLARACATWKGNAEFRRRVHALLASGGLSFASQSRKAQVWKRWSRYARSKQLDQRRVNIQTQKVARRLLRCSWNILRVHAFQSVHSHHLLQHCFRRIMRFRSAQLEQRHLVATQRAALYRSKVHRILKQWRRFTYSAGYDRRRTTRVCMEITRRRFFRLWRQVYRNQCKSANFRQQHAKNNLLTHFRAWQLTHYAIMLHHHSQESRVSTLLRTLFLHWAKKGALAHKRHLVRRYFESKGLLLAVSKLKALAKCSIEQMKAAQTLQIQHEKRLLRRVWASGWLAYHRTCKRKKNIALRSNRRLLYSAFKSWKQTHAICKVHSARKHQATAYFHHFLCKTLWRAWVVSTKVERQQHQALKTADIHYSNFLLHRGLESWRDIVSIRDKHAQLFLQVRQNARSKLKVMCFHAWKDWAHSQQHHKCITIKLQGSRKYQKSMLNPKWRSWLRWREYNVAIRYERRSREHFQARIVRQVIDAWHRHVVLVKVARQSQHRIETAQMKLVLNSWRSRTHRWQKNRVYFQAAMRHHYMKLCAATFQSWLGYGAYCQHVCVCIRITKHKVQLRLKTNSLKQWLSKLRVQQRAALAVKHLQHQTQRWILRTWRHYTSCRVNEQRKLVYFERIYTKYPHTSLFFRTWIAWKKYTEHSSSVKRKRQRYRVKVLKRVWLDWIVFCRHRSIFRAWRQLVRSCDIKSSNSRLRLFRRIQRRRLKTKVFKTLRHIYSVQKHHAEHIARQRSAMYHELRNYLVALKLAKEHSLRLWFKRWKSSENRASVISTRYYFHRLLSKVIQAWWRVSVHNRQDRVLSDAKRIVGTLSYYGECAAHTKAGQTESLNQSKPVTALEKAVRVHSKQSRRPKTQKMSAMVDPVGPPKFSNAINRVRTMNRELKHGSHDLTQRKACVHRALYQKLQSDEKFDQKNKQYDYQNIQERILAQNENTSTENTHVKPQKLECHVQRVKPHPICPKGLLPSSDRASVNYPDLDYNSLRDLKNGKALITRKPGLNKLNHQRNAHKAYASPNEELPLYDVEFRPQEVASSMNSAPHILSRRSVDSIAGATTRSHLAPSSTKTLGATKGGTAPLSLAYVAALDVYDDNIPKLADVPAKPIPKSTVTANSIQKNDRQEKRSRLRSVSLVPVQRDDRSHKECLIKGRLQDTNKQELSEILGLHNDRNHHPKIPSQLGADDKGTTSSVSLDAILDQYELMLLSTNKEDREIEGVRSHEWRVCFEMVRGMGLLQNDFFICEFERVFEREPPLLSNTDREETDTSRGNVAVRLKLFLQEVLTAHPAYIRDRRRNVSATTGSSNVVIDCSRQDEIQFPALKWLSHTHLPLFLNDTSIKNLCWIRHDIPELMNCAFTKFIPIIKKYTGILGQFFARGASAFQLPTIGSVDPRDYKMPRTAFFELMKKARVFPQLFHRRELERAFDTSVITCRGEDAVNFPEFVELLIHCSSLLEWGNLKENPGDSATVGVIKFLMLIFAMEGRGSVLRKRSKDLDIVIELLDQQQRQRRVDRMQRFKTLLEEQEVQRRSQRKWRAQKSASPVLKVLSELSKEKCPSPSRTFDDLTQSWDFTNNISSSSRNNDINYHGMVNLVEDVLNNNTASEAPIEATACANATTNAVDDSEVLPEVYRSSSETRAIQKQVKETSCRPAVSSYSDVVDPPKGADTTSLSTDAYIAGCETPSYIDTTLDATAMNKDEFLEEIIQSIGNIEHILIQSSERPRGTYSNPMVLLADHEDLAPMPPISDFLVDDPLPSMFSASLDDVLADVQLQHVQSVDVKDAMLDYLTDVTRFCESNEDDCMNALEVLPVDFPQINDKAEDKTDFCEI